MTETVSTAAEKLEDCSTGNTFCDLVFSKEMLLGRRMNFISILIQSL